VGDILHQTQKSREQKTHKWLFLTVMIIFKS